MDALRELFPTQAKWGLMDMKEREGKELLDELWAQKGSIVKSNRLGFKKQII